MEYHEFPKEEYEQRYLRLRQEMRRQGIDALLVSSEPNYRYLCGHYTQLWANWGRPRCLVLPLVGEPVVIVGGLEVGRVRWTTWLTDIRYYSGAPSDFGFGHQLVDLVAEVLRERGVTEGRIGAELGMQMRMGLSVNDYERLKQILVPARLVDASDLLWRVRGIKSALEIVYVRRACQILNGAYADLAEDIVEGMTESELYRRMTIRLMEHGAERQTYIPVNFHEGNRYPVHDYIFSGDTTERQLKRGNMIDLDGGCIYRGYWSDWNRTFAFGAAPEQAKTAYRLMQDLIEAALRVVRPGMPVAEVARACTELLRRGGYSETQIGRVGHGIGLSMPEPPSIMETEETILRPGMVLCVEPSVTIRGYGSIVGEEQVVVTENGYEILSTRANAELPVL